MPVVRFGEVVFATLAAAPAVVALVGTPPRVYPSVAPQSSQLPVVVYQVIDEQRIESLGGFTSGTRNARVQVDVYAETYTAAQALADAVAAALGALTGANLSSVQVSRRDLYEDESQLHRVSTDFSLWSHDT